MKNHTIRWEKKTKKERKNEICGFVNWRVANLQKMHITILFCDMFSPLIFSDCSTIRQKKLLTLLLHLWHMTHRSDKKWNGAIKFRVNWMHFVNMCVCVCVCSAQAYKGLCENFFDNLVVKKHKQTNKFTFLILFVAFDLNATHRMHFITKKCNKIIKLHDGSNYTKWGVR